MPAAAEILVVDDDEDIRETLVDALEASGYTVASAADGLDALERLRRDDLQPALILLDLMMPRMNGMELHAELASVDAWAVIPIVVVSADAHGRTRAEAMGAVGYLRKPMQLRELLATVARFVGQRAPDTTP